MPAFVETITVSLIVTVIIILSPTLNMLVLVASVAFVAVMAVALTSGVAVLLVTLWLLMLAASLPATS